MRRSDTNPWKEPVDYERFALIYDSEAGQLGRAALSLLEVGIDVLYAADPDEAQLLAAQERERLGALLVPSSLEPASLSSLLGRVCPFLGGGVETLVPVGLEPSPAVSRTLRRSGVRWCLWEPFETAELRFVTAAALMSGNPAERRKKLRVPAQLLAGVVQGDVRRQAVVCDLSNRGAYLGIEPAFEPQTEVTMELQSGPEPLVVTARVAHTHPSDRPPRTDLPGGMGVEFSAVGSDAQTSVSHLLDGLTRPFRL